MKLFIILDGVADMPCIELGGKTPLEAAKTKNLDILAKNGKCGYAYPLNIKIAPESDSAVISLLGYDPQKFYTGRGPLEAAGAKISINKGDLALRCNFGSLIDGKLVDRRAGRTLTDKEAEQLCDVINKNVKIGHEFILKHAIEHRAILVIRGNFSPNISNVDPAYERTTSLLSKASEAAEGIRRCKPLTKDEKAEETAKVVNDFVIKSYATLKDHPINIKRHKKMLLPANILLPRDAGIKFPNFTPKKIGWAAIAGMPLEKGIAKLCGMTVLSFDYPKLKGIDVYKHLYKDLKKSIKIAKKHIKKGYFKNYYIHFKETDVPGHDKRPFDKKKMIEILDKKFFKFVRKLKCKVLITADHSTPCVLGRHSDNPVPVLLYGEGKDDVQRFTEKECRKGALGKLKGTNILTELEL